MNRWRAIASGLLAAAAWFAATDLAAQGGYFPADMSLSPAAATPGVASAPPPAMNVAAPGNLALPAPIPLKVTVAERSFSVHVRQGSATAVRRLRDALATRALVHQAYVEGPECAALPMRFASLPDVEGARALCRRLAPDAWRTVELGWSPHPQGGFELHVHGTERQGQADAPNPDLATLRAAVSELGATGSVEALHELAIRVVNLNHAQTDRALALLKAVGYSTIEYAAGAGESIDAKVYQPLQLGQVRLPVVVKMLDPTKTSHMDAPPAQPASPGVMPMPAMGPPGGMGQGVPDLGGSFLHQVTADDPIQRLLVVHDPDDPESLEKLLRFLRETVDVAARQISVEALVLEVDTDKLRDIGVEFNWMDKEVGTSFGQGDDITQSPFQFLFDKQGGLNFGLRSFSATLTALVKSGHAEILSNPSVLVLDGRQARIQIGQRVPIVTSTATANTVSQVVQYETVGIVLNLRPRLDAEANQVSMQVETIVSAIAASVVPTIGETVFAPTFENRHVQSFVRVPDATPFIVGGLIADERKEEVRRVPGLSRIPLLGNLFKRQIKDRHKREVIIVITPHVLPEESRDFGHVIPKESDEFDSFDNELFRNTYRIREQEVFDLGFIAESPSYRGLAKELEAAIAERPELAQDEAVQRVLDGVVPGEEVLVRRMLWETIRSTGAWRQVDPEHLIYFVPGEGRGDIEIGFVNQLLDARPAAGQRRRRGEPGRRAAPAAPRDVSEIVLEFDARTGDAGAGQVPTARLLRESIASAEYRERLLAGNARGEDGAPLSWSVVLPEETPGPMSAIDLLRSAVLLQHLLELNSTLPLEVDEFYAGRQLLYPSDDQLQRSFHVVDAGVARLFYEIQEYYLAFEQEFNHAARVLRERIGPAR